MRRFVFLLGVVVSARAFGQASNATAPAEWEGIRPPFHRDLDAMVSLPGGSALLFRGDEYGQYDPVKRQLGSVFNRTPFLRKVFYQLLAVARHGRRSDDEESR